ncbi:MAG: hypothetical protein LVR00_02540 [Rhabdochlamydiaceae bacterium]|jgi:hypothetical protein
MDRLDDNLNNYEKALNRIESELSQEALPHTELASRKIELKKIGENLTELQGNRSNTIEKRSEKAAANALNPDLGLGASESALEKIKELEGRVAASEELIKQKEEKSTWASGLGQWISGWFSTPSVPQETHQQVRLKKIGKMSQELKQ